MSNFSMKVCVSRHATDTLKVLSLMAMTDGASLVVCTFLKAKAASRAPLDTCPKVGVAIRRHGKNMTKQWKDLDTGFVITKPSR